ncbi:MAG: hypothetical protein LBU92_04455 [Prevotellaceae bacterium]|jgi:hypothetical protein|nr:hypothetical protein [Prevotellaceae bacterium]
MVLKKHVLCCWLVVAFCSVALAQPASDTAVNFSQSVTSELIELDLTSSDIIELDADEAEIGGSGVSGLLGASRDVFASQVSYNLSPFRFNPRGYRSDYTSVYFNGFSFRDPETGYANYNTYGGLNDAMRNYTTVYSLAPSEMSFGNFAGTTTYSTRASGYRKQTSVSLAASNRTYAGRMMATYASGLMENGWAVTASASARLASEGFLDGTPYEAYAYFLAAEKQLNKKHALNLTIFGAPLKRGMSSAVIQDVYDLTDYHYNPNWGFQGDEKRSARIRNTHMPVAMLNYYWDISQNSRFEAGFSVQTGRNGTSALDWFEGNDPRPDYYRKLPRYNSAPELGVSTNRYPSSTVQNLMTEAWQNNISKVTQIDWDALYQANYAANQGVAGEKQAMNIVKEYRNDQTTFSGYVNYRNHINRYLSAFGGVEAKRYKGSFFQTVLDPLGADYYLNMDKFLMSTSANPSYNLNETTDEQRRKYKGDKYGYDYDIFQNEVSAWGEAQVKLNRFDFFAAGQAGYTGFYREGHMKNGRVEELMKGRSQTTSKTKDFITWGAKANATYKITGRHFVTANAGAQTRAPQFRNSYVQIRYADIALDDTICTSKGLDLQTEKIYTADIAYIYRGPLLRVKVAGFFTLAQDLSEVRTFYDENTADAEDGTPGALIEYITQGLNKQYTGVEFGVDYKLSSTLTAALAASHGSYIYASNPNVTKMEDSQVQITKVEKAMVTGYALGGIPQTAASATLTYRSPKYWWVALTGNVVGNTYVDMYLDRRTESMVGAVTLGTDKEKAAMKAKLQEQEKYPWAYTLDLACGATWKVSGGILGFSANASNLTNNFFKTGGYEQTRVPIVGSDHRKATEGKALIDAFPAKYYYSFGFNFFAQVYYRF